MDYCHVISIGCDCATDEALQRYVRRIPNLPLDKAGTPDLRGVFELILNGFDHFLEEDFEPCYDLPRIWSNVVPTRVKRYGIHFRHRSYSLRANPAMRCANMTSLARGCIRMVNALSSGEPVLLLRNSKASAWVDEFWMIDEYVWKIREAYRNPQIEILQTCVPRSDHRRGDWFNSQGWEKELAGLGIV